MSPAISSLNEIKNYINAIDFTQLINKLVTHHHWLRSDAVQTAHQYRNYLFLRKKYDAEYPALPPSQDIDEFWHNHILDTEVYMKDCLAIFGEYLHHYPYFGIDNKSNYDDLNAAFAKTKELYLLEFNEAITATRSQYPKIIYYFLLKLQKMRFNSKLLFLLPAK